MGICGGLINKTPYLSTKAVFYDLKHLSSAHLRLHLFSKEHQNGTHELTKLKALK